MRVSVLLPFQDFPPQPRSSAWCSFRNCWLGHGYAQVSTHLSFKTLRRFGSRGLLDDRHSTETTSETDIKQVIELNVVYTPLALLL